MEATRWTNTVGVLPVNTEGAKVTIDAIGPGSSGYPSETR